MTMTTTRRPRTGVRRFGYVVAVLVNLILAWLIAVWPGWDVVPFLTPDTTEVLPFVYASIATSILVNLVYVADDRPAVKATGELVNALVGFVTVMRIWQVFPFDLDGQWVGWEWLVYAALIVGAFGTAIGAIVQLVTLVRIALRQQH
ncbi:hypothetical protein ACIA03_09990 [Nocardioides sp. NPDC051685]|uniref:hypothetical protein n=1 Tax=Nocardioides sp. NPDC051685 TaxID=3364334 RepID=UPI0037886449